MRGPTADLTLLKHSRLLERLPPGVSAEGDLAYVGIGKAHPQGLGFTPRRKPRGKDKHRERGQDVEQAPEDIAYNQAFARSRIIVEHTIGRLRHYAALTVRDRHHLPVEEDDRVNRGAAPRRVERGDEFADKGEIQRARHMAIEVIGRDEVIQGHMAERGEDS